MSKQIPVYTFNELSRELQLYNAYRYRTYSEINYSNLESDLIQTAKIVGVDIKYIPNRGYIDVLEGEIDISYDLRLKEICERVRLVYPLDTEIRKLAEIYIALNRINHSLCHSVYDYTTDPGEVLKVGIRRNLKYILSHNSNDGKVVRDLLNKLDASDIKYFPRRNNITRFTSNIEISNIPNARPVILKMMENFEKHSTLYKLAYNINYLLIEEYDEIPSFEYYLKQYYYTLLLETFMDKCYSKVVKYFNGKYFTTSGHLLSDIDMQEITDVND